MNLFFKRTERGNRQDARHETRDSKHKTLDSRRETRNTRPLSKILTALALTSALGCGGAGTSAAECNNQPEISVTRWLGSLARDNDKFIRNCAFDVEMGHTYLTDDPFNSRQMAVVYVYLRGQSNSGGDHFEGIDVEEGRTEPVNDRQPYEGRKYTVTAEEVVISEEGSDIGATLTVTSTKVAEEP